MTQIERSNRPLEIHSAGLSESTRQRIRDSVPASTQRAYAGDWARFTTWCNQAGRCSLPASPDTLAEYVNHLADAGRAPSTISRAIAGIVVAHGASGAVPPAQKPARAVLRTYRGERAAAGRRVQKATPITVKVLRTMVSALDTTRPVGIRDRALLVLGFALGARRAEIAGLDIEDLTETAEGFDVLIRQSKTDRESVGRQVAVLPGAHEETCPVRTVRAWLAELAVAGRTSGPLFLRIDRHGGLGRAGRGGSSDGRISPHAVALVVARVATAAGIGAGAWSGHSLRRGFATATYGAGANPLRIARHGGWRDGSATLLGYIEEVDRWSDNPLRGLGL